MPLNEELVVNIPGCDNLDVNFSTNTEQFGSCDLNRSGLITMRVYESQDSSGSYQGFLKSQRFIAENSLANPANPIQIGAEPEGTFSQFYNFGQGRNMRLHFRVQPYRSGEHEITFDHSLVFGRIRSIISHNGVSLKRASGDSITAHFAAHQVYDLELRASSRLNQDLNLRFKMRELNAVPVDPSDGGVMHMDDPGQFSELDNVSSIEEVEAAGVTEGESSSGTKTVEIQFGTDIIQQLNSSNNASFEFIELEGNNSIELLEDDGSGGLNFISPSSANQLNSSSVFASLLRASTTSSQTGFTVDNLDLSKRYFVRVNNPSSDYSVALLVKEDTSSDDSTDNSDSSNPPPNNPDDPLDDDGVVRSGDDYTNHFNSQTTGFAVGATVFGRIHVRGDKDAFYFDVTQAGEYVFETMNTPADKRLIFLTHGSNGVDCMDIGPGSCVTTINLGEPPDTLPGSHEVYRRVILQPGRYFIKIAEYSAQSGFDYQFRVSPYVPPAPPEPTYPDIVGDSFTDATVVGIDHNSVNGSQSSLTNLIGNYRINDHGDLDVFKIVLTNSRTGIYTFSTQGSTDTRAKLYDAQGNLLSQNDDHEDASLTINKNFRLGYELDGNATYYLEIRGRDSGPYDLYVFEPFFFSDTDQISDEPANAKPIALGQLNASNIDGLGDTDYWVFVPEFEGEYLPVSGGYQGSDVSGVLLDSQPGYTIFYQHRHGKMYMRAGRTYYWKYTSKCPGCHWQTPTSTAYAFGIRLDEQSVDDHPSLPYNTNLGTNHIHALTEIELGVPRPGRFNYQARDHRGDPYPDTDDLLFIPERSSQYTIDFSGYSEEFCFKVFAVNEGDVISQQNALNHAVCLDPQNHNLRSYSTNASFLQGQKYVIRVYNPDHVANGGYSVFIRETVIRSVTNSNDDHSNNTDLSATDLNHGDNLTGYLHLRDADVFEMNIDRSGGYYVNVTGGVQVEIYDAFQPGVAMTTSASYPLGTYNLREGRRYYAVVRYPDASFYTQSGNFTISLSSAYLDDFYDKPETATELPINTQVNGNLSGQDDVDYLYVKTPIDGYYKFRFYNRPFGTRTVFNPSSIRQPILHYSSYGIYEVSYYLKANIKYYMQFLPQASMATYGSDFTVKYELDSQNVIDLHANERSNATAITLLPLAQEDSILNNPNPNIIYPHVINGQIDISGDEDFFSFVATRSSTFTIKMKDLNNRMAVELQDAQGNAIANAQSPANSNDGFDFELSQALSKDQTYYIKVYSTYPNNQYSSIYGIGRYKLAVIEPENIAPNVSLSLVADAISVRGTASFAASANDPDGLITKYLWDFDGDGTIDQEGPEATVDYQYPGAGSYTAKVFVEDDDGARSAAATAATATIEVLDNQLPNPSFTINPDDPFTGDEVSFDASASTDLDSGIGGNLIDYRWEITRIEGTTVTTVNLSGITATHSFDRAASYNVKLIVTDGLGETAELEQTLVVQSIDDHGDTTATASKLSLFETVTMHVAPGDTDYLELNIVKPFNYYLEFSGDPSQVQVLNQWGGLITNRSVSASPSKFYSYFGNYYKYYVKAVNNGPAPLEIRVKLMPNGHYDDHANYYTQATSINSFGTLGTDGSYEIAGNIERASDHDYVKFHATSSGPYIFEIDSSEVDTRASLWDLQPHWYYGQQLRQLKTVGPSSKLRVAYYLDAYKSYYLMVREATNTRAGRYKIKVINASNLPDDRGEDLGTTELASSDSSGGAYFSGEIEKPADKDSIRFTVSETNTYALENNSSERMNMEIFDTNGSQIFSDDIGYHYPDYYAAPRKTVDLIAGQSYIARVSHTDASRGMGSYSIGIQPLLGWANFPAAVNVDINNADTSRYFKLSPNDTKKYSFSVTGDPSVWLEFYDENFKAVGSQYGNFDTQEYIYHKILESSKEYYLRVRHSTNSKTGAFTINSEVADDFADTVDGTNLALSMGSSQAGRINRSSDLDVFTFRPQSGGIYAIDITANANLSARLAELPSPGYVPPLVADSNKSSISLQTTLVPGNNYSLTIFSAGTVADYTINIRRIGFDYQGYSQANAIDMNSVNRNQTYIVYPGAPKYFRFNKTYGSHFYLPLAKRNPNGNLRLRATITNAWGQPIYSWQDHFGTQPFLSYGTYYIRVEATSGGGGFYFNR